MRTRTPSSETIKLLSVLLTRHREASYGYELMKLTGLESGTLYPILTRLHDRGLLEAEWHAPTSVGRPARHAYRLTKSGMQYANEHTVAKEVGTFFEPRSKLA